MPLRGRPQLSITLPKNFTYHYKEGEQPKTPDQEIVAPVEAPKPPSPHAYRVRRRTRPSVVSSNIFGQSDGVTGMEDVPIPTIEFPLLEKIEPAVLRHASEPVKGYLSPFLSHRSMSVPRTPLMKRAVFGSDWVTSKSKELGDSISRPMSACSILSDSSDDSNASSEACLSLGGSCTSPESDSGDPFSFSPIGKGKSKLLSAFVQKAPTTNKIKARRLSTVKWTPDMDRHIWTCYLIYLQDPTVTPFKMIPGSPPPLGVCHRVTREAKRTWRGLRMSSGLKAAAAVSPDPINPAMFNRNTVVNRGDSPDTIKPERSGSSTPTAITSHKIPVWPKSNAATRRRLRELCKRKATIAPHYQRLLQSRSPTPFSPVSRSTSRPLRMSSPLCETVHNSPFSTHDIQMSLTTSTAITMQPNGPLAKLSKPSATTQSKSDEWFNEPNVPWASPAPVPSEVDTEMHNSNMGTDLPRLGSPFGYHTWGPSRSRQQLRPSTPRTESDIPVQGPQLRSPIQLHGTFPYPSTQKRRAQHQLEEDLSPGGTDLQQSMLEELFGGDSATGSSRRVRSRGFTTGDVSIHDRLTALYTPSSKRPDMTAEASGQSSMNAKVTIGDTTPRLGSPFIGINSRPSRIRGRHVPSASLSSYDPNAFSSIDQRLGQSGMDDIFK